MKTYAHDLAVRLSSHLSVEASSRAERGIAIEAAKKEARVAAQADLAAKVSRKGGRPNSPGGKEQATGAKIEF